MHPLVVYDIARLEQDRLARLAEQRWHVRAARMPVGRSRRHGLSRLQRWLRRPALPVSVRGAI
jgi:hypothetical protein